MEPAVKTYYIQEEAKAWLRFDDGATAVMRLVPETDQKRAAQSYAVYAAYIHNPDCLGRILFDAQNYWIYDGDILSVAEQEQLAHFIINYEEKL